MRIIAGEARGRTLKAPRGEKTRPTSDRVREALFSILEARLELAGVVVLDLYAGSGALALEALSRGAERAVLVDRAGPALRVLRENVHALGYDARCRVLPLPAEAALVRLAAADETFGLILADPPYADDPLPLLADLSAGPLLASGGLVVFEHDRRRSLPAASGRLTLEVARVYGDTALSLYA
ncbi:MAG: 16S rRNA (guanine(966)-N(2))-methyltransferase RsmD [Deltaproteobacteria bacterium]|nr:16S rRNA (guanine(966)-N(2))-methyltransferase RsmD [Deltaproteobacteria bacterium]